MYLFDEMHVCSDNSRDGDFTLDEESGLMKRRPKIESLHDVFLAIRRDELEHVKTMQYLQKFDGDIQICNVE